METNNKKGSGEPQTRTNGSAQTRNANGQFAPKSSNKVKGETLSADFKDTTGDRPAKGNVTNPVGSNAVKSDLNAPNGSAPQRDENGRFTKQNGNNYSDHSDDAPDDPSTSSGGYYIRVTGADDNLFLLSVFKAFNELLIELSKGYCMSLERFKTKIEGAGKLFNDHAKNFNRKYYSDIYLDFGTPNINASSICT